MSDLKGFVAWLREDEMSQNTIDQYSFSVREFFSKYDELTKANLIDYKQWLLNTRSPRTADVRCIAMNRYCVYAGKPELRIKTIKIHKAIATENVIKKAEYEKLLDCLEKDKDWRGYWLIEFMAKTGARVSELIQFQKKDLERGYCELWTKGKIRRIYIPDMVIEKSKAYFESINSNWLFPSYANSSKSPHLSARGIDEKLKSYAKKYGIRKEVMHPHSFRHLFGIEFVKRNKNIALLADLMGHESVDTTAIYLRLSAEEQAAALNAAMDW